LCGEGSDGEFFSHLYFFSTIQKDFSQHLFQFNWYPAGNPSSAIQGNKGKTPPSLPASWAEKAVTMSLPLIFIFSPPFQFFSHSIFFQLNCYSGSSRVMLFFLFIPPPSSQFYHAYVPIEIRLGLGLGLASFY